MREQFRVDLRGIVDILSHHLYSSPRVYLRELVQNARDAVEARTRLDHDFEPLIDIVPARGPDRLIVRDNGVGLSESDMRELLSVIGGTSKRSDVESGRRRFLGQFGIGLLSCFLVADSIEVISRSARSPDAPTLRWVGYSDGTFTIGECFTPLASPGTEVRLRPRHGSRRWCDGEACLSFAREFTELLDVPVQVGSETVSQRTPPWELPTEQQLAWCSENFGFEAMGIIPLEVPSANISGLAFVLPYTSRPGYRTGDQIYSRGMLVADTDDLIVPRWAFFCRAVIDAGDLPLTASRQGLQESGALHFVRRRIGFHLISELIIVQGLHPDVYRDIVRLHADGLKTLAVQESDVRDLLRSTLPFETTYGERTIQQLIDSPAPIPYVTDADAYAALSDVAAYGGVLLVNASGLHEAELLAVMNESEPGHFREIGAPDVVELARPIPWSDTAAAARLTAKVEQALPDVPLKVHVASFEPSDRPVLWWPAAAEPTGGDPSPDDRATMVLNSANPVVKRLVEAPAHTDLIEPLRSLYITGLLLGRTKPTMQDTALLSGAVLSMTDGILAPRE